MTELELLSFSDISSKEEELIQALISDCILIELNESIKLKAIKLRRNFRLKLPDALIAATALYVNVPLISADSDFNKVDELFFVNYQVV